MTAEPEARLLPLFPLGLVQVPGLPVQLQIFEPRYLRLLEDLGRLPAAQREFGVVAIRSGHEVGADNLHATAEVGCAVRLRHVRSLGNRFHVEAIGTWRFRVRRVRAGETAYLRAEAMPLTDTEADPASLAAAGVRLRAALERFVTAAGLVTDDLPDDPVALGWLVIAQGVTPQEVQVRLLAETDPLRRLDAVSDWLRRETGLLRSTHSVPFSPDRLPPDN